MIPEITLEEAAKMLKTIDDSRMYYGADGNYYISSYNERFDDYTDIAVVRVDTNSENNDSESNDSESND